MIVQACRRCYLKAPLTPEIQILNVWYSLATIDHHIVGIATLNINLGPGWLGIRKQAAGQLRLTGVWMVE